ncbi:MAG: hypothetical protein ABI647_27125 [Gemmatimonadota bacterium]
MPEQSPPKGYDQTYAAFDSSLMQRVRREAYGEDIGQHSWVTADELRSDLQRLGLTATSRLLDLFGRKRNGKLQIGEVTLASVEQGLQKLTFRLPYVKFPRNPEL